jgi:N-acetylglucosaminyl-diphospho-decaprenol L-rhamnosyltransferase
MVLSVIIVNYNACYFLEQCLCSLRKSIASCELLSSHGETEIIVVDNHSTDQSRTYLIPKFPDVTFIFNSVNTGFAKASNQALRQAKGANVLFLNPDTILAEETLCDCIAFFTSNPNAAALGVRMIDGAGHFLKESKRGFPFPWAAFCRLSGLSALFPRSKLFAAYYQGFLSEHETHEVEVLSGAFLFVRKKILTEIGGFDEQFFMYAEDIDLCYRIWQAGFKNYYLASTSIIHFKGESTKKDAHYVHLFYKAMVQFIKKHFGSGIFVALLEAAIWMSRKLSAFALLFSGKPAMAKKEIKTYLVGDINSAARVQERMHMTGREIVHAQKEAHELIFCEGKSLSFKSIIHEMEKTGSSMLIKIHAEDSFSIVGSSSKKTLGETIAL